MPGNPPRSRGPGRGLVARRTGCSRSRTTPRPARNHKPTRFVPPVVTVTDRVPALSDTPFEAREFVGMWATAAATYGAGDTLTTLGVVGGDAAVVEANPVVSAATSAGGVPALVLLKLLAFLVCLALALHAAGRADRFGFYFPPATLVVIGAVATTTNLVLLAG